MPEIIWNLSFTEGTALMCNWRRRFYSLAERHSHGVRLAKRYELDSDLLALAMKSNKAAMLEAADYLAERGQADKAATLYLKAGRLRQAVDMCFSAQLFDVLHQVRESLDFDTSCFLCLRVDTLAYYFNPKGD
jgi:hypothetical protein